MSGQAASEDQMSSEHKAGSETGLREWQNGQSGPVFRTGSLDPLEEAACEGIRQKYVSSFVPVMEGVLDIETRTG